MGESDIDRLLAEARSIAKGAEDSVAASHDSDALAKIRAQLIGKKGAVKALQKRITEVPKEDRRSVGQSINEMAGDVRALIERRKAEIEVEQGPADLDQHFDPTEPGRAVARGSSHPLSIMLADIRRIFTRLGFDEVTGPEVEDAWHNFDALNIPEHHPARSPQDQFYVEGGRLLRSQTSTVQIRVMETNKPPLRVFAPGRVFRPETVDATHLYAFQQVEGLMVGPDVTFADLKGCLISFVESLLGKGLELRFRPHNFPFTEVSAELDVRRPGGGWMEVLGCGMVHPNVFRRVGYDPEEVTGFAFGVGVERLAMRRWNLTDIRSLVENDVRFLRQFG